tara:strand:- start:172 stop:1836 length:1665 start_codon:yes stop_codon:yes gene_type:complete
MLYLRSIFFYFLAIKIFLRKIYKNFYFSTKIYQNSLQTKRPQKFKFFPKTFHYSLFTNYKNFSFKITEIDPENFWKLGKSETEIKRLNEFLWLNLLSRKSDAAIIRRIIINWIKRNEKINRVTWGATMTSRRVLSWIFNAEIMLNSTNKEFQNLLIDSIIKQVNHLKLNYEFEIRAEKKVEILSAILVSGLVFSEYSENFEFSLKELKKIQEFFFDKDGFPLSRNPNDLIVFCKYFVLIRECTKDAQKYIPDFLNEIIDKNLSCLKKITTPDNKIPLFNGAIDIKLEDFYNYLENLNINITYIKNSVGKIEMLKNKKDLITFDAGGPPIKDLSNHYQSGPLSFEYYSDKEKVITNCGFGQNISSKAMLVSRLTSAQSTLCLNDTSIVKFERSKILNSAFGNSIKTSFKIFNNNNEENDTMLSLCATHNAYEKKFGYFHKRSIEINKINGDVIGFDILECKKSNDNIKYSIRFHLYPGVDASLTLSGKSVLLKLKKNKSILFLCDDGKISLEKSIFFGGNKLLNNLCINVAGNLNKESKTIKWVFKKKFNNEVKN